MNVAIIAWCEATSRFSEGTESSCATATECAICDRYTPIGLFTFVDAQCAVTLDVRTAGWIGRLVHVADDLVDFTRGGDVFCTVGIWARCGCRNCPRARSGRRTDHRDRYRSHKRS